ncbi:MAG: DUF3857 and transglutaminase domain-containing protein [Microscillaceae bacterium]|jgi:hypothetical protein|nr:DUF3857 and transglutaminase domain-containing protein [Microscillaceae bacterium]
MRKHFILFFLITYLTTPAWAGDNKYPVSAIPSGLKENAMAVLRTSEEIFTVMSAGNGKHTLKIAITILSKEAQEMTTLVVPYDKLRQINYIRATLYDALGNEVKKLKKTDIRDFSGNSGESFVDDNRVKIAEFNHNVYPHTVEFEYEMVYDGLMFYPSWDIYPSENIAIEYAYFKAIVPSSLKLRYRELNFENFYQISEQSSQGKENNLQTQLKKAVIKTEGENDVFVWEASHLPIYKRESFTIYAPPFVYLAPSRFEIEGYQGNMSTWEDYGNFIQQLNATRDELPEATKAKLRSLTAGITDPVAKIKKVYEYLQSRTRYVGIQLGIGGWQPFPAKYVDEKGYGDCKALSNYTQAMLKAIGIESFYTLIYAGRIAPPVLKDFPTARFNHAILCVPVAKDTLWLECTSQTEAFGYAAPNWTGDRHALIVTSRGGKVVRTTRYTNQDNQANRIAKIQIDAEGNALTEILAKYRSTREGYRSVLVEEAKEEQKKWLYENLNIPSFDILDFELNRQKDRLPLTTEKLKLSIRKYAAKTGKRMAIPLNVLNRWEKVPDANLSRQSEVVLGWEYDFIDSDTLTFQLPEAYALEYKPEDVNLKSKFGEYQMKCKWEGNTLVYTRRLAMNRGRYPKESYPELVEFLKNIAKADKQKMVLVNKLP